MATYENNVLPQRIDKDGNIHIDYYVTKKENILDFPNSLPADGGNADTIGGKAPKDFAAANHTHEMIAVNTEKIIRLEDTIGTLNKTLQNRLDGVT